MYDTSCCIIATVLNSRLKSSSDACVEIEGGMEISEFFRNSKKTAVADAAGCLLGLVA